tara:strand:+ start:864 stop:1520 length:657 start_codon:yes stop_codon:yes gene_type:complete
MKRRFIIALILFLSLSTIISQQKFTISKFDLKDIEIENNFLIKENDIKKLLASTYNRNLILLKNKEIEEFLVQISFIESFKIKKKYPSTLKIEIFEKKPIAILIDKKKKFYLSEKIELIEFKHLPNYQNLPYVIGKQEKFKILYKDLLKINFPFDIVKKYTLFEAGRWNFQTFNNRIIKLPSKNYLKSLENYLSIRNKVNLKKYKVFDYRIDGQLILK